MKLTTRILYNEQWKAPRKAWRKASKWLKEEAFKKKNALSIMINTYYGKMWEERNKLYLGTLIADGDGKTISFTRYNTKGDNNGKLSA